MAKASGKLAAALLSLVLALCVFTLPASAGGHEDGRYVTTRSVRCAACGGQAELRQAWNMGDCGLYEVACPHKAHGTDLMKSFGTACEDCAACGYHDEYDIARPVLRHCGGFFG